MKRIICIAVVFICLLLTACGEKMQTGYVAETEKARKDVYITGVSDGAPVAAVEELNLEHNWGKREDAPKYIDIEFENIAIHGVYEETRYLPDYDCDYDVYWFTDEDGRNCSVGKNIKTGEIVSFSRYKDAETTSDEKTTREERLSVAEEYLKKYTNGEYVLFSERENDTTEVYHTFFFRRVINGLPTADEVRIIVNTNGEFCSIAKVVAPAFYDTESLDIDIEKCDSLAEAKAKETVGTEEVTVSAKSVKHLKSGDYGVEYKIEYPTEYSDGHTGTEAIWLFVYAQ